MTHGCSESEGCSNDGQHSKDRKSNRVYTPDLRMKLAVTNKDVSYIHILVQLTAYALTYTGRHIPIPI